MKKFIFAFALLIGIASFNNKVEAQSVNISINIGNQPAWGPVGYDYVDYYYMPDINCYYNVNLGLFYYSDRGQWISARYLPYAYRNYDLYGMYKVVLVNTVNPWRYNNVHYRDYGRYRGYRNQYVIRDSRDDRYRSSRNNRISWYSGDKHNNYRRDNNNNYNHKDNRKDYNYNNSRNHSRNDGRNNNSYNNNARRDDNRKEQNYNNSRSRQVERNNSNVNSSRSANRKNDNRTESTVSRSSERSNYRTVSDGSGERVNRR